MKFHAGEVCLLVRVRDLPQSWRGYLPIEVSVWAVNPPAGLSCPDEVICSAGNDYVICIPGFGYRTCLEWQLRKRRDGLPDSITTVFSIKQNNPDEVMA